ncbi:MAG: hypothetical protein JWO70_887, partial [Betaproteobacteria bacterium]|nr:hypothetical protein [Betaproteobacteria bacterium]
AHGPAEIDRTGTAAATAFAAL